MAPATQKNGNGRNGFVQRLVILVLGGGALAFFGWLGLTVIQIKVALGSMDTKLESLIETRRDQTRDQRQNTGRRLNNLEEAQ